MEKLSDNPRIILVEETCQGSGIREVLAWNIHRRKPGCTVDAIDLGREFVPHGSQKELYRLCGMDAASIANFTREVLS